ncbi:Nitrate reductase molybdenum cofactor assembly chaperone NarJ [wastewater metagenome]|uniref:Nitrate reductase molybdenum cofactor assembly chaperone NarJ n=2 Tax=unclassified sequences TaxID=12908 RepID=A0A5B8RB04_9ZZZZ|nr:MULTISPECIES: nitrate reductase molybdenum cofactor assembly chaperone [Arhodomonas]MCS4502662.1 nitrate reductase molybdenum cofactor assembly chaperone [Arhodomonas aquaeolei]QEA03857.1 nitrate reductase molybdenum cofactor assembly chaperone NarJ [uncultured organism]
MQTLKVIAALLHYPDAALQRHVDEILEALDAEALVTGESRRRIGALAAELRDSDLLDVQSRYVETFDRGRARSLYLFEHVHGESRDRGAAMVDLQLAYRAAGFEIAVSELPDYVPLFLEFCASLPDGEALAWLEEVGHLIQLLHARLAERESPYAVLLEPLLAFAAVEADESVRERVAAEPRDDTPEALDAVWMEAPVTFGPEGGCGAAAGRKGGAQPVQWGAPRSGTA